MGFDIECIIDIQTYPGEFFCPVCRTLVYPNEALQSQCSHLYCKPCLAHIANGSKACPYDGYLVTEADSKPLIDRDKSLAEKIGKVKVHCLFFRSGCTWEGTLSDCTSHCSGCSFGNSPVICNRCGIQIVHRQVHDHAQSCPGVYEAQPATGVVPGATITASVSATTVADLNHTNTQSGKPLSQPQNLQNVVTQPPGQNPNMQSVAQPQAPAVAASLPATDQWYQQQYQQYYLQYPGYDPYLQPQQPYYSLQQYQQNSVPVQGQPPSHAYAQPSSQLPVQSQPLPVAHPSLQLHPQVQSQSQPIIQTQPQTNFPQTAQGQGQSMTQVVPPAQSHVQVPTQGQPQLHPPHVHSLNSTYQVNPQQPTPIPMRPPVQVPSQFPPTALHNQPTLPPSAQSAGAQPASSRPPVHQPHMQMHPSQVHLQPQTQVQNQVLNQSHLPTQLPLQYHNQPLQVRPPPTNLPAALPQPPHTTASGISGHLSYPQPQPVQQGTMPQYPVHQNPVGGPSLPSKVQGPVPQQPVMMRPPPPQGSMPLQQSSAHVPPHSQVMSLPPAHQQTLAHAQPPRHHLQHGASANSIQPIPIQSAQQLPYLTPAKGQVNQQTPFPHHQPPQPQFRPYGSSQSMQSQNYVVKPTMSNDSVHSQSYPQSSVGFDGMVHTGLSQPGLNMMSANQNYAVPSGISTKPVVQESGLLGQGRVEKDGTGNGIEMTKDVLINTSGPQKTFSKDGVKDGIVENSSEKVTGPVSSETRSEAKGSDEDSRTGAGSHLIQQKDQESKVEAAVTGPSSNDFDKVPQLIALRPEMPVKENPLSVAGPQAGILPHSDQSFPVLPSTPSTGRGPGYYSHPSRSFESPIAPGPPISTSSLGITGKTPKQIFDSQSGLRSEAAIFKDQKTGSSYQFGERLPIRSTYNNDPIGRRTNGETDFDSKFGFQNNFNQNQVLPTRHLDQASRPLDDASVRSSYDSGVKSNPGVMDPPSRFMHPHHPLAIRHGPGTFPGPGNFHHRPFGESIRGDRLRVPYFGDPSLRSSYSMPGFPNSGSFAGEVNSFDPLRKRKSINMGWCRICQFDCDSVEGLEMHSQTREHQKMAMDMVKTIKLNNKKRTAGNAAHEGVKRNKNAGINGRGN